MLNFDWTPLHVNVHVALWIDEVLYAVIWQKYPLFVGLLQHAITNRNKKCVIGGIYRHPNNSVKQFASELDCVLSNVIRSKIPCVVAVDVNIDLSKIEPNVDTANYVDMVLTNNFSPTILMPTRINPKTSTLIDHVYYYTGGKLKQKTKIFLWKFPRGYFWSSC